MDLIYLYFMKAFDKIPYERLGVKLEACRISGMVQKLIKKWLKYRRHKVRITGKDSRWVKTVSGVPKGSVPGPLLFIIYINYLDLAIS